MLRLREVMLELFVGGGQRRPESFAVLYFRTQVFPGRTRFSQRPGEAGALRSFLFQLEEGVVNRIDDAGKCQLQVVQSVDPVRCIEYQRTQGFVFRTESLTPLHEVGTAVR